MAVYKLIQDIEAEDKLLGPLTLKAFIYALIAAFIGFINYQIVIHTGLGNTRWLLLFIFFWPMALFGILASPLGHDQPTEVWLLSHIRFLLKPRVRIWNQSGIKETVTITAPKKVEQPLTKQLSAAETKSRLKALATTLDSRGWAIKNIAVNESSLVDYLQAQTDSDRLISADSILTEQSAADINASDDILDPQNNAKARQVDKMLQDNAEQRRADITKGLSKGATGQPQPGLYNPPPAQSLSADRRMTATNRTDKLKELAQSGNALSVATVAKLANQVNKNRPAKSSEVVIPLH